MQESNSVISDSGKCYEENKVCREMGGWGEGDQSPCGLNETTCETQLWSKKSLPLIKPGDENTHPKYLTEVRIKRTFMKGWLTGITFYH